MVADFLGGGFGFVIFVFLVVLAILWFVLPFAVFGIKSRMDRLIAETRATKKALHDLIELQRASQNVDQS